MRVSNALGLRHRAQIERQVAQGQLPRARLRRDVPEAAGEDERIGHQLNTVDIFSCNSRMRVISASAASRLSRKRCKKKSPNPKTRTSLAAPGSVVTAAQ